MKVHASIRALSLGTRFKGNTDSEIMLQGSHRLYECTGMESNGVGQYWGHAWTFLRQGTVFDGSLGAG